MTHVSDLPLRTGWDNPTCTQGVVSVPRGARAMMACNISNPFSNITICLSVAARTDCQYIFRNAPQGNTSQDGWHLRVQGGMAQLVIEDAWDNQSGQYKWRLQGGQINVGITTLNVSGGGGASRPPRHFPACPPGAQQWLGWEGRPGFQQNEATQSSAITQRPRGPLAFSSSTPLPQPHPGRQPPKEPALSQDQDPSLTTPSQLHH